MNPLEQRFQDAIDHDDIPGAILVAQDNTGKFNYAKAFGQRTLLDGTKKSFAVDDILNTFSATKLITTIAVLQCVEKGHFKLDEDVSNILPEVDKLQVLTGFDEKNKPQMTAKDKPITLSMLLTHSSGMGYDFGPPLSTWRASRGEVPLQGDTFEEKASVPLVAQPATIFNYGFGVDWAGRMVERATGKSLEEYFHEHILGPLDIKLASYWPLRSEVMKEKMADLSPDDPTGAGRTGVGGMTLPAVDFCLGGGGLYMSPLDYVKVMQSLLANDEKLLQEQTVDMMFEPHLPLEAHNAWNKKVSDANENRYWGQGLPVGAKRDYGYGGLLVQDGQPGWFNSGTLVWGGGVTLAWFIDRKAGLCGFAAPQYHIRDMPSERKPGEEAKPWREGGQVYEKLSAELKQVFKEKIYGVFEQWKKDQA